MVNRDATIHMYPNNINFLTGIDQNGNVSIAGDECDKNDTLL